MSDFPSSQLERLALRSLLKGTLSPTDGRKWKLLQRKGWVDDNRNITKKGQTYGEKTEQSKTYQAYFDGRK